LPDDFVFVRAGELLQKSLATFLINERSEPTALRTAPGVQLDRKVAVINAALKRWRIPQYFYRTKHANRQQTSQGLSVWEIKRSRDFRAIRKNFSFSSWKKLPLVYSPIPHSQRFFDGSPALVRSLHIFGKCLGIGLCRLTASRRALFGRMGRAERRAKTVLLSGFSLAPARSV
jgi:hypothetical protein